MSHYSGAAKFGLPCLVLAVVVAACPPAFAQLRLRSYASGFTQPVAFVQDATDPAVQFVVEQGGRIRVLRNAAILPTDFLDLSAVVSTGAEHGLLNMVLDPYYATNGRFFVYFTDLNGNVVVSRFRRSSNPLVADSASRFDIRWGGPSGLPYIEQPFSNNKGGGMAFNPSNPPHPEDPPTKQWLFVGVGDGGGSHDPLGKAQDRSQWLGKILILDVDVPDSDPTGYAVPAPDPSHPTWHPEIYAYGIRNPWRFNFGNKDLSGGLLYFTDSGEDQYEEVNCPGYNRNYGWPLAEGPMNINPDPDNADPVYQYDHGSGSAIVGGYFYDGTKLGSAFKSHYFFGDRTSGRIWDFAAVECGGYTAKEYGRTVTDHTSEFGGSIGVVSFGVDAENELYIVAYADGTIYAIDGPSIAPVIIEEPMDIVVRGSTSVRSLIAGASGTPAPAAQWQVTAEGGLTWSTIAGATSSTYTFTPTIADNGKRYRAVFTNAAGSAASRGALVTVYAAATSDADRDNKADLTVWRASTGTWYTALSSTGYVDGRMTQWGSDGLNDIPLTGDIDGDGRMDVVVWRPGNGTFYWCTSPACTSGSSRQFGSNALGDKPFLADIDGDGRMDLVVWRSTTGTWYWLTSSTSYADGSSKQFGNDGLGDKPFVGDFDADGKGDFAVWRSSTGVFYWTTSSSQYTDGSSRQWGDNALGDRPFLADIDGDAKSDLLVWRALDGTWYWTTSSTGYLDGSSKAFGSQALNDVPLVGDIDGDRKADLVVWRANDGTFYWTTSSSGYMDGGSKPWGSQALGDVPIVR